MGRGRDKSLHQKPSQGTPGKGALGTRPGGGAAAARGPRRRSGRGAAAGVPTGSYRVGDAPQEHAHQRVCGPEHLHFLLHEMLLLGFGGEAESRAGASSCRGCGSGRDGGGRHGLPRTRASGSGSWSRLRSPTRKRCSPARSSRDRRPALRRASGAGPGELAPPPRPRGGHLARAALTGMPAWR